MLANVASALRRLHDTDKSGWYQLLFLIPMAGFILWLIFMCTEGTRGDNQYGPNPLIAGANPPTSSPSLDRTPPSSFPLTQEGSVPNQLPTTEAPQKPEDPQVADLREKLANAEAALTEKTVAARQQERRMQLAEHIHALEEEIADAENDLVKLQNPDNNA